MHDEDEAPKRIRKRDGHVVWVRDETYAVLNARAQRAGVSVAQLIAAAVEPPPYVTASAEIAIPLAQVSYRLAQIEAELEHNDVVAARVETAAARGIVADALRPLRRSHARETRAIEDVRPGDWERG